MAITEEIPKVGDKGYYSIGSDCYPVTVMTVSKAGNKVTARQENFKAADEGHDYYGIQKWECFENPKGKLLEFHWTPSRKAWLSGSSRLVIGRKWHAKQDPSF